LKFFIKRNELLEAERRLKDKLINDWESTLLYKSDLLSDIYSPEDWKKFYTTNPNIIKYKKDEKVYKLFTKLYIIQKGTFYIGEVNLDGQMNGEGTLYTKDGFKYTGNFINNIFTGWGCIIDREGTYTIGKTTLLIFR